MKGFFVYVVILFSFFLHVNAAIASENYDITYTVNESGNTHVVIRTTLTNTTTQYFATKYQIDVGFTDIENLRASDPEGAMTPELSKNEEGHAITVDFNARVVGKDSKLPFTMSFDTNEVASKQGSIWEINVPGFSNRNELEDINVHVRVPTLFGKPAYIKPFVGTPNLDFTKEDLGRSGISIAFGKEQIYEFALTYHLKNTKLFPIKTEISIPPSTNYQEVLIEDITPKPLNVVEDKDGNWLAEISLLPSERKDVIVRGKARLYLSPKKQILSTSDRARYLLPKQYWEAESEKMQELAREFKIPQAIYEYVVKTLRYDFSRVTSNQPRQGGLKALENPSSAVCLEFTDLFIALARAAGIPAREIDGFAYTENKRQRPLSLVKDILHAWPEYYDDTKQTWIMVDPTWGNTTQGVEYFQALDFDHFAFVIKGEESAYPIPAGGYKLSGMEDRKDVHVTFAQSFEETGHDAGITAKFPKQQLSGFPIIGSITLTNVNKGVLHPQKVRISTDAFTPLSQHLTFGSIPPYGHQTIPVSFDKTPFLTNKKAVVTIHLGSNQLTEAILISPIVWNKVTIVLGGVVFVSTGLILSLIAKGAWRVLVFRQKR